MSWADSTIQILKGGDSVQIRPRGNSMQGIIDSGQLVTLKPVRGPGDIAVGNAVLCTVEGKQWLHLILATANEGGKIRYQIGNNKGHVNGWTGIDKIYGVVTAVEN